MKAISLVGQEREDVYQAARCGKLGGIVAGFGEPTQSQSGMWAVKVMILCNRDVFAAYINEAWRDKVKFF